MLLHRAGTDVELFRHLSILHPLEVAHPQYLVGRRREVGEHLLHQFVLFVGIVVVEHLGSMKILVGILVFEHQMAQVVYRAIAHGGHQIGINLGEVDGFDVVPQSGEHIVQDVLGSLFLVHNVQGIVIQPSIILGVYLLKPSLIYERL
mgnify:CR=1 FL=1